MIPLQHKSRDIKLAQVVSYKKILEIGGVSGRYLKNQKLRKRHNATPPPLQPTPLLMEFRYIGMTFFNLMQG